uniref:Small integral membrane protein 4 n=1 Tax=Astatotilapia calliptera TaxID=8154 RepID=A0AAX7TKS1_ASTCA
MFHRSKTIKDLLNIVPGKRRLGAYRFLPIFFCIGGIMEWIMINVRIGQETFCKCKPWVHSASLTDTLSIYLIDKLASFNKLG